MLRLRSLGLSQPVIGQLSAHELESRSFGRVIFESHAHCVVALEDGDVPAELHPRIRGRAGDGGVVVGDWVAVDRSGDPVWVVRRLERERALARRDPGGGVQVLCANVDVALVATALDRDLNPRRLERYLAVAAEAGIPVAVVLTKVDLDPDAVDAVVAGFGPGFDAVLPVSAATGLGVDAVRAAVPTGRTAALLGSSGVGKTTLINALAGTALATGEVREDDRRGRHTTTHRRLVPLPGGGWLVDNPGLRQVGPLSEAAVATVFEDVGAIAARCRFGDCSHGDEPGCAIAAAIDAGQLDPDRYDAWVKLERELAYEARRRDRGAQAAERARWKKIHRDQRERDALRRRNR